MIATETQLHGAFLWTAARGFSRRVATRRSKAIGFDPTAVSAVLLAAMSVEAFLNDVMLLAAEKGRTNPPSKVLADALETVEASRGSVRCKLLAVGDAMGKPLDKGRQPYQDFTLLFSLRDSIAHAKPHIEILWGEKVEPRPVLSTLISKKLVAKSSGDQPVRLLEALSTPAVCAWAVETARGVIEYVGTVLPPAMSTWFPLALMLEGFKAKPPRSRRHLQRRRH